VDVEQQAARGVADIRGMDGAAGQLPKQPGVDGAEGEFATIGGGAGAGNVIEYPGELGGGKIGVEHQAGALAQRIGDAAFRKPCASRSGAPVLPDDGVA
jgi:RecA/RadA recombinase